MTTDEWLTEQCSRAQGGDCRIRSCMRRGGWDPNNPAHIPVDFGRATCHAWEALQELRQLRSELEAVQKREAVLRDALGFVIKVIDVDVMNAIHPGSYARVMDALTEVPK